MDDDGDDEYARIDAVHFLLERTFTGQRESAARLIELAGSSGELLLCMWQFVDYVPAVVDTRFFQEFMEFLLRRHRSPQTPRSPLRSYRSDVAALGVASKVCLKVLAERPAHTDKERRLRQIVRILRQPDPATGHPLLRTLADSKAASLVIQQWPSSSAPPPFNTIRLDLPVIRTRLSGLVDRLGLPGATLSAIRVPSAESRLVGKRSPVRAAIALVDECSPILALYPSILLECLEQMLRTMTWSSVRPFDDQGRMNPRYIEALAQRDESFCKRAHAFCEDEPHIALHCRDAVQQHLIAIFRLCMRLAVISPGNARCEEAIDLADHHEQLVRLLELDDSCADSSR